MTTRTIISHVLPRSLHRPVALSSAGLLRFWATVYEITSLAHLQDSTTRMHLGAIDAFYRHVEEMHGDDILDRILNEADVLLLSASLEGFFLKQRNLAVQNGSDHRDRWQSVWSFVEVILRRVGDAEEAHHQVNWRIQKLTSALDNLRPNPKLSLPSVIRALPSGVLQEVYEIFDPESGINPFRGESRRWRNHCLFLALLHQGLRRGEALLLGADAVKSGRDDQTLRRRYWMNVQNLFAERQIPVSEEVANRFQHFSENHRGISPYPHLFLNSSGTPLGSRSVSKIMRRASSALSEKARQQLVDALREPKVTAHDLRHTCAVIRLFQFRNAGVAEEDALQKLRAFFGWTYDSIMPRLYARAYWERHVAEVWNDDFDAHVDAIRAIEHSVEWTET